MAVETVIRPFRVRHANGSKLSDHDTLEQAQARAKVANEYAKTNQLEATYVAEATA